MGIVGLLQLLKSSMDSIKTHQLKDCTVAVDAYSWLHKGACSCSRDLCKGLPTTRHIDYCMNRVNVLRDHGVKPYLVFDGAPLPMKLEEENKRARYRKDNLARALELEAEGKTREAYEFYKKAVDISPTIAHELIQHLRQANVDFVVAPYEADAQMTFLALAKQVDAIITEDSDLIPFGCPRIIYKMDQKGNGGVEFLASKLELSLSGFSSQMLLEMCILSGCDYLKSPPRIGLIKARELITKFKSYDRVIKHLTYSKVSVPHLYEESFKKAILTFKHQRVYDPIRKDVVHLSAIPEDIVEDLDFLGPSMPKDVATGIALGQLNPVTHLPFQAEGVTPKVAVDAVSPPRSLKTENVKKKRELPVQKNLITNYFCKAPRISPMSLAPREESPSTRKDNSTVVDASSTETTTNESPAYSLGENTGKIAEERESPYYVEKESHGP